MKINIIRTILIILLIAIFTTIFDFSNQDGKKSGSLSREITEVVTKDIKSIQKLEKNAKEEALKKIEHVIRKIAHFSIYTLVGILMMSLMYTYKLEQSKRIGVSFVVGFLYAISDEIHQAFIPDRSPLVGDVCIDSCGVIVGIGIVVIVWKIIGGIKQRKKCY